MVFYNTAQEGKIHSVCHLTWQRKALHTDSYNQQSNPTDATDVRQDPMQVDPQKRKSAAGWPRDAMMKRTTIEGAGHYFLA